jgi:thioredoxin 1
MNSLTKLEDISTGVHVIKFFAEWCAPCRTFSPIMESVAQNVDSVGFWQVNVDEGREIPRHFNISNLPSLVVVKEGKVMETLIGLRNAKEVTNIINKYKS